MKAGNLGALGARELQGRATVGEISPFHLSRVNACNGLVTSTIMPAMELMPEAAHYVIGFYGSLMTDVERRAQRHLSATMKATLGRSDVAAQKDAQRSRIHSKFLSEDPNVFAACRRWL